MTKKFHEEMTTGSLWSDESMTNRIELDVQRNNEEVGDAVLEMKINLSGDETIISYGEEFDFTLVSFTADEADAWADALKRGAAEVRRLEALGAT